MLICGLHDPPASFDPPEGVERVRGDVYRADVERWEALTLPEGAQVSLLSLEEIFLALTGDRRFP